jgi:Putative auto-transporter adhesin, head GIN domain
MIKMKIFFAIIILLTVSTLLVSAQVTETRSLANFSSLSVGEAISVTLIPGNKNEAVLTARNIALTDVETEVIGNRLKIELRRSRNRNIDVEIKLTYKSLTAISVSSAADVVTKGPIKSASLDLLVSSAGTADLDIVADNIDVEVSSAGELRLKGKTESQRASVSSAGEFYAYDLECNETYVKVSSAGSARVNAAKKIDARVSSGGSVKYIGDPDKVYVNSSSGGSAKKAN